MYLASNYRGRQMPELIHDPPTFHFHVRPRTLYSLIMLGYSQSDQPRLHMLYINITDPRNIKPANIITSYCASATSWPKAKDHHTYITYLFEQRHPIYGQNTIGDWGRARFDIGGFVAKYGLKSVASAEFYVEFGNG